MALIVAREVDGRSALQCQLRHAANRSAVVNATGILAQLRDDLPLFGGPQLNDCRGRASRKAKFRRRSSIRFGSGVGRPNRSARARIDHDIPIFLHRQESAGIAGCAGRPKRMSPRCIVDDKVPIVLHRKDSSPAATRAALPQSHSCRTVEFEVSV